MPSFYIGSLLIMATLAYLIWGPQGAVLPVQGFGWDLHLVLPALVLAARAAAQIAQMSSALLVAELDKTYVVAARSVGQPWRAIRGRHALRNVAARHRDCRFRGCAPDGCGADHRRMAFLLAGVGAAAGLDAHPARGHGDAAAGVPLSAGAGRRADDDGAHPPAGRSDLGPSGALLRSPAARRDAAPPRGRPMTERPPQAALDQFSAGLPRRRNWPLIIGLVLVLCILFLAVFGPSIALRDPLETNTVVKVGGEWVRLPYPPFAVPGFPLGSDAYGRDLLSRLLWGIRPTLILVTVVACVRLVLGVLIGLAAGWSSGRWGRILEGVMSGASAIPVIIVSLAVITAIGIQRGLIAFIVGLVVTGWAETARLVSEQTRGLKSLPYIEASGALGASGTEMLARHVVRQISPMFGMLLAFEAGSTLMTVAALGFLGYYVGGAFWIEVTDFSTARHQRDAGVGADARQLVADLQAVGHGCHGHGDLSGCARLQLGR